MRSPRVLGPVAVWTIGSLISLASAVFPNYTEVPSANLDLSSLGRVALTGNFEAISVYQWLGQTELPASTNGSQSLFAQLPNGAFQTLVTSDGGINAMCPFVRKDGTLFGVIVGGNFTSLSGVPAQGIALFNVTNNAIVPLPGLRGSVNALFCDQQTDSVYVGGEFQGANSTNAIAWFGDMGWTNTPFQGFNAPVHTIAQSGSGNIIWGGEFSGLNNMSVSTSSDTNQMQVINLSTANVSASGSTSTNGFSDPKNIVCRSSASDGPGTTWLLQDNTPGYWQANFNFGFTPSKIRIWNTRQDGRGVKTWRFSNNPDTINSILRLNYTDPVTKQSAQCDQTCPLSNDPTVQYQDFTFVNPIGMNSFRISVSEWYGNGGGLDGIEVFQDDIFSYAVSSLNEPACSVPSGGSNSTATGPWTLTPSSNSVAQYLTASLPGPGVNSASARVTFQPDIKVSGNYTVIVYTPGCQQDNNCGRRGIANVTASLTAGGRPIEARVYQTNNFDKYDQIYTGFVDATSGGFRPTITLQPLDNQNDPIDLVALRVGFQLLDASSVGLNGLYEYNPLNTTAMTSFRDSKIDTIGTDLEFGATVSTLLTVGNLLYVGGKFDSANASNFAVIDGNNNTMRVPGNGLNGPVSSQANLGNVVYLGGNFTATKNGNVAGLSHVATFDATRTVWGSLGAGVDGIVTKVVPLAVQVEGTTTEQCMSVNGDFKNVLATGGHSAFAANGFAIWVPRKGEWLKNLGQQTSSYSGRITATTNVTIDGETSALMSGTIIDQGLALRYAAGLTSSGGNATLNRTGLNVLTPSTASGLQRRADTFNSTATEGIYTGLFAVDENRLNMTIFGGHFTAASTNGSNITNLAIIDDKNNGAVLGFPTGIDTNSTFRALSVKGDILYAGGSVTGTINNTPVNGFVAYNLVTGQFNSSLPPALGGPNASVSAITSKPSSYDLYVGGSFTSAGGLGCPGVCLFSNNMWARPGTGFNGNVSAMSWQGNDKLLVVGNLTVQNNQTSVAIYDTVAQSWSIPTNAGSVPGPITALTAASTDGSSYWVSGQSNNGSAFLMRYDGSNFVAAPQLGSGSVIRGLSVLNLAQSHESTALLDGSLSLLVTGSLNVQPLGSVSGALFNGTGYTPFLLTNSGSQPGNLGAIITENQQSFNTGGGQLAVGFVVLIALAIALALIFLLILVGLLIERRRRAAEGYRPAPQNYFEKTANMGRIPPERLFGNLSPTSPRI